jgi:HlyD family secretion protein
VNAKNPFQQSLTRHLLLGFGAILVLGGIIFWWATFTEISGAVIAPGKLAVDSNVKKVQHPTGGVVGDLRVKDGDHVKKGGVWPVSTRRRRAPTSPS